MKHQYCYEPYPNEFKKLLLDADEKFGVEYMTAFGLGDKLNLHEQSKKFYRSKTADFTIDVNSNISHNSTMVTYFQDITKPTYVLNNLYLIYKEMRKLKPFSFVKKTFDAIFKGAINIQDAHHFGQFWYCYAYSCLDWAIEGIPALINPKMPSAPPQHFDSFMQQTQNLLIHFSNTSSGAVAFPDLLVLAAYFINKDRNSGYLTEDNWQKIVEQKFQQFIFECNQNTRLGVQSPFSNISYLDRGFIRSIFKDFTLPDGSQLNDETIEFIMELQDIFMNVYHREYDRNPMTFPVLTAAISKDPETGELLDPEGFDRALNHDLHHGCFNWFVTEPTAFSSCCRLKSDIKKIYKTNSLGSSGVKVGSLGVVTLVMPNIQLYNLDLEECTEMVMTILRIKKKLLQKRIDQGKLPFYKLGWVRLDTQYQTVGVTGIEEFLSVQDLDFYDEEHRATAHSALKKIQDHVDANCVDGDNFNMELIPAENTAVKTAKLSRLQGLHDFALFSNQVPSQNKELMFQDRVALYAEFEDYFTGGSILHLNFDSHISDKEVLKQIVEYVIESGATYFVRNEVVGICEHGHVNIGVPINKHNPPACATCGGKLIDFRTRVVGFQTSISDWSDVRKNKDYYTRKQHKADNSILI